MGSALGSAWRALARDGGVARRQLVAYAALEVVERVASVAVAWAFVSNAAREPAFAWGAALALGGVFAARASVRVVLVSRVHAALHLGATDALLAGDVLAPTPIPEADAEASVLEGVTAGEVLLVGAAGGGVASLLASVVLLAAAVALLPLRAIVLGGVALAAGGVVVAGGQKLAERAAERSWAAYVPVLDGLVTGVAARLEIVGNGADERFRRARVAAVAAWRRRVVGFDVLLAVASRVPLLAAAAAVALIVALDARARGELDGTTWAHAAVFAAALPSFAALGRALLEARRQSTRFAPLAKLLEAAPRRALAAGGAAPGPAPDELRCERVTFRYAGAAALALDDVSVVWRRGQLLTIAGRNGSGKSTLLRVLLGVGAPERGAVRVDGVALADLDDASWRARVAYLPQRPFLVDRETVAASFALLGDVSPEEARRALSRVGLGGIVELDRLVGSLSVGQRQRVALARVLAADKPVVLLDEPDANLDAEGARAVVRLVRELADEGRTVAVAAHTPELVAEGDVVVALSDGRVVDDDRQGRASSSREANAPRRVGSRG